MADVSTEFLAAQFKIVIDNQRASDARLGALDARLARMSLEIRHMGEKLDAVLAEHDADHTHHTRLIDQDRERLDAIEARLAKLEEA